VHGPDYYFAAYFSTIGHIPARIVLLGVRAWVAYTASKGYFE
jgi:hypothetical protein